MQSAEREPDDVSLGDVAAAVNGYRAVFDHLVSTRTAADADLGGAEAKES